MAEAITLYFKLFKLRAALRSANVCGVDELFSSFARYGKECRNSYLLFRQAVVDLMT